MNHLLPIIVLAFAVAPEALTEDTAFCICQKHKEWSWKNKNKETGDNTVTRIWKDQGGTDGTDDLIKDIYSYNKELERMVNIQINNELSAFYNYLNMSRFFKRYDQDREGFAKYLRKAAMEELGHAESFMTYQQMRGGRVKLHKIDAPKENKWRNGKDVLKSAFELEKDVTGEILCLHSFAVDRFADTDFTNFLEEKVIPEQYESMKEIKTHIKTLDRACTNEHDTNKVCDAYPIYELRYDEILNGAK